MLGIAVLRPCLTRTYAIVGFVLIVPPSLSTTLRLNISIVSVGTTGALNIGVAVLEPNNVTGTAPLLGI
jgi:hypothetical protein